MKYTWLQFYEYSIEKFVSLLFRDTFALGYLSNLGILLVFGLSRLKRFYHFSKEAEKWCFREDDILHHALWNFHVFHYDLKILKSWI